MAPGVWQIAIVVLLAAVLFGGRGKIAAVMGDFAKGITSFRKGLREDDETDGKDGEEQAGAIDDKSREDEKTGS
ncbi:twin-arginine translocase TatA/TatE family subunit [Maricaulis sp.]|jgi:sec-independent protein translocase protein TatA|uniref:twin-arginine translocase TatA/TatE family subunit n=1 Tax=Maricaulis sp. TaxID=1486257 RepID=UPI00262D494D|nr:twin-arginine translocase TatA/TatE family subunit [Maricaulis sp.]